MTTPTKVQFPFNAGTTNTGRNMYVNSGVKASALNDWLRGRCMLSAAYGQEHADRHQDETDRPLKSDGMRWSPQQPELIYGRHGYDLAEKHKSHSISDTELWGYPCDTEDVKGYE